MLGPGVAGLAVEASLGVLGHLEELLELGGIASVVSPGSSPSRKSQSRVGWSGA